MAHIIDFNSIIKPMLEITLRDAEHTRVHVTTPTQGLIERLSANADQLKQAVNGETAEAIQSVFTLAADLINCNLDGFKTTAEELRDKYKLTLYDIIIFYNAYLAFIDELKNAKN